MKALTLWQPWASALFTGKGVENRPWAPPLSMLGQVIVIHAGVKYDGDVWRFPTGVDAPGPAEVPQRAFLGAVRIVGWLDTVRGKTVALDPDMRARVMRLRDDPWYVGPVGWMLDDARALPEPVPHARGALGLWDAPQDIEASIRKLYEKGP